MKKDKLYRVNDTGEVKVLSHLELELLFRMEDKHERVIHWCDPIGDDELVVERGDIVERNNQLYIVKELFREFFICMSTNIFERPIRYEMVSYKEGLLFKVKEEEKKCKYCGGDIAIRNPTGQCDHLYYPENVNKNYGKPKEELWELFRNKVAEQPFLLENHAVWFEKYLKKLAQIAEEWAKEKYGK